MGPCPCPSQYGGKCTSLPLISVAHSDWIMRFYGPSVNHPQRIWRTMLWQRFGGKVEFDSVSMYLSASWWPVCVSVRVRRNWFRISNSLRRCSALAPYVRWNDLKQPKGRGDCNPCTKSTHRWLTATNSFKHVSALRLSGKQPRHRKIQHR